MKGFVILDNAVVYDCGRIADVRMCVILRRCAMRRPTGMADTDTAR